MTMQPEANGRTDAYFNTVYNIVISILFFSSFPFNVLLQLIHIAFFILQKDIMSMLCRLRQQRLKCTIQLLKGLHRSPFVRG